MMRIECPGCHKGFNIPEERCPVGKVFAFSCPSCKHRIKLDLRTESTNIRSSLKLETGINKHQEKATQKKEYKRKESNRQNLEKKILQDVKDLPPMPQVVLKAQQLMADPDLDIKGVASLIETDQAIAIKVLKLANSAYYGFSGKVSSIQNAFVVLGYKTLVQILSIASFSTFMGKNLPGYGFESEDFRRHSLAVALSSKVIAEKIDPSLANEAHTAGLIHDIGKIILDKYIVEKIETFKTFLENEQRTFLSAEKQVLGFDHAEIAYEICKKWNIPNAMTQAIKYHHYPSSSQGDGLPYILHLADYIAAKSGGGYDSDDLLYQLEEGTLDYLDLRYEDVRIIMSEVIEAMAQLSDES
jgi:putative nucleotidyltransferase with HDIG domain